LNRESKYHKILIVTALLFLTVVTMAIEEFAPEVKPYLRVAEGYSLPFVNDVRQSSSPYWDISGGISYDYLTIALSMRGHFLSSVNDSIDSDEINLSTEGHTVSSVMHVEGKADLEPFRFVASIDLGMIWFHEYDHLRKDWSRSKLPIIGLGLDFRVPVYQKLSVCFGGCYMAAFEGFQVSAKAYNSISGTVGLVYDGGLFF